MVRKSLNQRGYFMKARKINPQQIDLGQIIVNPVFFPRSLYIKQAFEIQYKLTG